MKGGWLGYEVLFFFSQLKLEIPLRLLILAAKKIIE